MDDIIINIIEKLAAEKEITPGELTPPISEEIDPESLSKLLEKESVQVVFEYDGYEVRVTSEDEVTVTGTDR